VFWRWFFTLWVEILHRNTGCVRVQERERLVEFFGESSAE
jgi:hypothetical protein